MVKEIKVQRLRAVSQNFAKLSCNHGPHGFTAELVAGVPRGLDVIFAPETQAILTVTGEKMKTNF